MGNSHIDVGQLQSANGRPHFDGRAIRRYHFPMPVHALLDDLFFRARIEATAAAAGVPVIVSGTVEELIGRMREDGGGAVLLDLGAGAAVGSAGGENAVQAIRTLKALDEPPTIVAWGSHVDVEAFEEARVAGADRVLPRSAFTRRLPEILRELAGT
jgi:DNA-binding NarL/FixJ family response regulator